MGHNKTGCAHTHTHTHTHTRTQSNKSLQNATFLHNCQWAAPLLEPQENQHLQKLRLSLNLLHPIFRFLEQLEHLSWTSFRCVRFVNWSFSEIPPYHLKRGKSLLRCCQWGSALSGTPQQPALEMSRLPIPILHRHGPHLVRKVLCEEALATSSDFELVCKWFCTQVHLWSNDFKPHTHTHS